VQRFVAFSSLFSPVERTVIVLALTSPGECEDCRSRSWIARMLTRAVEALVPEQRFRPLANERLDALRRAACSIKAGMLEAWVFDDARAAGLTEEQLLALRTLATPARSEFLTQPAKPHPLSPVPARGHVPAI
jgi:alkylhydroperoxidase family enzyme